MIYQKNKFIFIPTKIRKMRRTFIIRTALAFSMLFLLQDQNFAQNRRELPPSAPAAPAAPGAGMQGPPAAPKTGPKPYKEVITAKAKTSKGLFTVHKVEEKYFLMMTTDLCKTQILKEKSESQTQKVSKS